MADLNVNSIGDASGGNTATINGYAPTLSNMAGRNRIINGDMRIDARNAGASVTIPASVTTYTVDRWNAYSTQASKFTVQQSTTSAVGFTNSLLSTSSSAYSVASSDYFVVNQRLEGLNTADLGWGTANAQTVTLSFWVRSSLTGTFGGAVQNSAQDRSYPFSFTVSSADVWEQKSITIAGDTSGTWLTTNGIGMRLFFNLGSGATYSGTADTWAGTAYFAPTGATSVVGTSGATLYITGVQLEAGEVATPFERRSYGTELALAQRYYYRWTADTTNNPIGHGFAYSTATSFIGVHFPVQMRARPTALEQSGTASDYRIVRQGPTIISLTSTPSFSNASYTTGQVTASCGGLTAGEGLILQSNSTSAYLAWSAEL